MLGSLGVQELVFIFTIALLIFGPRKLPEIGRTIGKGLAEFRKASTDLKRTINAEMIEEEVRKSDPRRILREDLNAGTASKPRETKPAPTPSESTPPEESAETSTEALSEEPAGASGTVARGSVSGKAVSEVEPAAGTGAQAADETAGSSAQ